MIALFIAVAVAPAILAPASTPASELGAYAGAEVPEAAMEAIRQGRYWRASRILRDYLASVPDSSPETILLAAQAEAGWGDWSQVNDLLTGRPWLGAVAGGYGWGLLGRSRFELGQWEESDVALREYLRVAADAGDRDRGLALMRRGLALSGADRPQEALPAFEDAATLLPQLQDWISAFAGSAAAGAGDTARVRELLARAGNTIASEWSWRTVVRARREAGDLTGAAAAARAAASALTSASRRAEAWATLGELRLAQRDTAGARDAFRSAMEAASSATAALDAARLMSDLPGLTARDRLRLGRLYLAHGNAQRGLAGMRAFLASGAGTAVERMEVSLEIGRALFNSARYAEAERHLLALAAEDGVPARTAADATFLAGRAQYRQGQVQKGQATFLRTAQRFPNQQSAAEALFLVADLYHDAGRLDSARTHYRRTVDANADHNDAGLALMRLGGIAFAARDYDGAAEVFEEYRRRHPNGRRYQQATYWAAQAYREAGQSDQADARFAAALRVDPLSYYGARAAAALGGDFWQHVHLEPAPPANAAVDQGVAAAMDRIDLLRELGLNEAASFEVDRVKRHFAQRDGALYALAEAFNERGYTYTGIQLGWDIYRAEGAWNPRLLRIVYPFPYREIILAEAKERGLDPFLVAGLIRQESMFNASVASRAGAIGLMQIMPATGRALARGAGIRNFRPALLEKPEVNLHLGMMYMDELLRRYGHRLTSVLAAYNAGPHRVARWRELPEYEHEELFAERIPFEETRNYVKIVQQNAHIYSALYEEAFEATESGE